MLGKRRVFLILFLVYVALYCIGRIYSSRQNQNSVATIGGSNNLRLTRGQLDTISKMKSQDMLNLEPQYNRAEIDPSLWASMKYSLKKDFAATLAIYCANQRGNNLYWCEIYDMYSGKKLAKYSNSWGFKVY